MKQHKWHKEIKAWADGAEIEYRYADRTNRNDEWELVESLDDFGEEFKYRIKPQPTPKGFPANNAPTGIKKPQYLYVWRNHRGEVLFHDGDRIRETPIEYKYIGKIKLEEEN